MGGGPGSGRNPELVQLWAEKAYFGSELDNNWHEMSGEGQHPYALIVTRGDSRYKCPLGWDEGAAPPLRPCYFPMDSDFAGDFWTEDQSGRPVLVLWSDNMSQGGAGGIDIYAFSLRDDQLTALPIPVYGIEAALDEETMISQLTVPESGYTDLLDLKQWLRAWNERNPGFAGEFLYREDGALEWPAAPGSIDGHCHVEQAEKGLTVWQYLYGAAHMDGMGYLVTTLTWENGQAAGP